MQLSEKLAELNYTQVDENCWIGIGADGKSDIHLCQLEEGRVEVVKKSHEEDVPAIIVTFSRACEMLADLLERWTWA